MQECLWYPIFITPLLGHKADRVILTGLAPELPEDLYFLIKKVIFIP